MTFNVCFLLAVCMVLLAMYCHPHIEYDYRPILQGIGAGFLILSSSLLLGSLIYALIP